MNYGFSQGYMPSSGIAGSHGSLTLSFLRCLLTVLHSGYISLLSHQQCEKSSLWKRPCPAFIFCRFFFLILLFLAVLGLCGCASFSLAVVSGGYSPALLCGLLAELASLVAEHGP